MFSSNSSCVGSLARLSALFVLPMCAILPAATAAAPAGKGGEVTAVWIGPVTGNWSAGTNWSTGTVPGNGGGFFYHAVIDDSRAQDSTVTLNLSAELLTLSIGTGDAVTIANTRILDILGPTIINDGHLHLGASGSTTRLRLGGDTSLLGSGTLSTTNTPNNVILATSGATRLTNGAQHTLRGGFMLGNNLLALTNLGLIESNLSTGILLDVSSGTTLVNGGTLRAVNESHLTIASTAIDNHGGLIEAAAGSFVTLQGGSVTGGVLRDADGSGPGYVRLSGSALAMKDLAIEGPFRVSNGNAVYAQGPLNLDGPIDLNASGSTTTFFVDTPEFTLEGLVGTINCTNTVNNRITGTVGANRLIVSQSALLRGSMSLGNGALQLTNLGLIEADQSMGIALHLLAGGVHDNAGVMRALNGATLSFGGGFTLNNAGGLLEAAPDSHITLVNHTITGGVLRDADGPGAGSVRASNAVTLQDLTLQGPFSMANGGTLRLRGVIDIEDAVQINASSSTTSVILETTPFELSGSGAALQFTNTPNNRITGAESMHRLVVPAHGSLRGGGFTLGNNQLQLTNLGLIESDGTAGIALNLTTGGEHLNQGTIRVRNGGTLAVSATVLDNTGGLIEADNGASVTLVNSTIQGGTLRDANGDEPGNVRHVTGSVLRDVIVEGGGLITNNGTTLTLLGEMVFHGPLFVNAVGSTTSVVVDGAGFTLQGAGGTRFTNSVNNRLFSAADGLLVIAADHTVSGSGQLGVNASSLTNQGAILASSSAGMTIDPINSGAFRNEGMVHAHHGNVTIAQGGFENYGTVLVDAGRTLARTGDYVQHAGVTATHGTLNPSTGSVVRLHGGALTGTGSVSRMVDNAAGTVAPGESAGVLTLNAGYAQGSAATLSVEIGGTAPGTQHDQLVVVGPVALAGTLAVQRIGGFTPGPEQVFTILTASGALVGEFEHVQTCEPVLVTYHPNSVTVQFPGASANPADLNGDGVVNGADLGMLLAGWGDCTESPCCPADLNGDGVVNGADLGTVLANWG